MAAKEVKFSREARDSLIRRVDILANECGLN
jgi:chaperonin GroEL (HSP60 family)